jgi:hypothetical protein
MKMPSEKPRKGARSASGETARFAALGTEIDYRVASVAESSTAIQCVDVGSGSKAACAEGPLVAAVENGLPGNLRFWREADVRENTDVSQVPRSDIAGLA